MSMQTAQPSRASLDEAYHAARTAIAARRASHNLQAGAVHTTRSTASAGEGDTQRPSSKAVFPSRPSSRAVPHRAAPTFEAFARLAEEEDGAPAPSPLPSDDAQSRRARNKAVEPPAPLPVAGDGDTTYSVVAEVEMRGSPPTELPGTRRARARGEEALQPKNAAGRGDSATTPVTAKGARKESMSGARRVSLPEPLAIDNEAPGGSTQGAGTGNRRRARSIEEVHSKPGVKSTFTRVAGYMEPTYAARRRAPPVVVDVAGADFLRARKAWGWGSGRPKASPIISGASGPALPGTLPSPRALGAALGSLRTPAHAAPSQLAGQASRTASRAFRAQFRTDASAHAAAKLQRRLWKHRVDHRQAPGEAAARGGKMEGDVSARRAAEEAAVKATLSASSYGERDVFRPKQVEYAEVLSPADVRAAGQTRGRYRRRAQARADARAEARGARTGGRAGDSLSPRSRSPQRVAEQQGRSGSHRTRSQPPEQRSPRVAQPTPNAALRQNLRRRARSVSPSTPSTGPLGSSLPSPRSMAKRAVSGPRRRRASPARPAVPARPAPVAPAPAEMPRGGEQKAKVTPLPNGTALQGRRTSVDRAAVAPLPQTGLPPSQGRRTSIDRAAVAPLPLPGAMPKTVVGDAWVNKQWVEGNGSVPRSRAGVQRDPVGYTTTDADTDDDTDDETTPNAREEAVQHSTWSEAESDNSHTGGGDFEDHLDMVLPNGQVHVPLPLPKAPLPVEPSPLRTRRRASYMEPTAAATARDQAKARERGRSVEKKHDRPGRSTGGAQRQPSDSDNASEHMKAVISGSGPRSEHTPPGAREGAARRGRRLSMAQTARVVERLTGKGTVASTRRTAEKARERSVRANATPARRASAIWDAETTNVVGGADGAHWATSLRDEKPNKRGERGTSAREPDPRKGSASRGRAKQRSATDTRSANRSAQKPRSPSTHSVTPDWSRVSPRVNSFRRSPSLPKTESRSRRKPTAGKGKPRSAARTRHHNGWQNRSAHSSDADSYLRRNTSITSKAVQSHTGLQKRWDSGLFKMERGNGVADSEDDGGRQGGEDFDEMEVDAWVEDVDSGDEDVANGVEGVEMF